MGIKPIVSFYYKASKAAVTAIAKVIKDNPQEFTEAVASAKELVDFLEEEAASYKEHVKNEMEPVKHLFETPEKEEEEPQRSTLDNGYVTYT